MTETSKSEGRETAARDEGAVEEAGGTMWYEEFYSYVDGMDDTIVERLCTPDTSMRFNYHEPIEGREAVRAAMHHFWGTIGGMSHRFVKVFEDGDSAVLEAIVTYTSLNGETVEIPVATRIDRREGLVASQHVYIDLAPLHALSEPGTEGDRASEGSAR